MPKTAMRGCRARIFFFFEQKTAYEIPVNILLGHLMSRFQRDGALDEATIAYATHDNFPWMNQVRLKHLLASGLCLRAAGLIASRIICHIRRKFSRCGYTPDF